MKLGVDSRMLIGIWKYRGIGRYIQALLKYNSEEKILAFLPKNQSINNYKFISSGISFFPIWEQLILPFLISNKNLNFFLFPSITSPLFLPKSTKNIIIVYDLIFMIPFSKLRQSHSIYNNIGRLYRRFFAPLSYGKCDYLISISEFSKNELTKTFNISREKIFVIPCSITDDWFIDMPVPASCRERYFLAVTGDGPSKNLYNIISAFSLFLKSVEDKSFKLRIVGVNKKSQKHFFKFAEKINIVNNLIFENFVENHDLQNLYRNAWCSLTLSLFEGFGIPIVEAMASGTPVICSNTTSMPEVGGKNAIYANPNNQTDMALCMEKIFRLSPIERDYIAINSLRDSHKFSEGAVKKIIIDFWNKIGFN
jgi:glycosyltransferase involved in cell wall biosynthesis